MSIAGLCPILPPPPRGLDIWLSNSLSEFRLFRPSLLHPVSQISGRVPLFAILESLNLVVQATTFLCTLLIGLNGLVNV